MKNMFRYFAVTVIFCSIFFFDSWGAVTRTWTANVAVGQGKGTVKVALHKVVAIEYGEEKAVEATDRTVKSISTSQTASLSTSITNRRCKYTLVSTNTGYTFSGWYDNLDCTGTAVSTSETYTAWTTTSSKTASYYAKFTPNTYKVAFNGNGNFTGTMTEQSFTYDVSQNLKANSFGKSYSVSYNTNGGTSVSAQTASAEFLGWATSASGAVVYSNQESVNNLTATNGATINLYAKWGNIPSVVLPTATKSGYVLEGWYNGDDKVGEAGGSYTPTANVTLTAHWTQHFPFTMSGSNQSMKVDDTQSPAFTFTHADNPTAHISNSSVISYDPATNTITALSAGTATIYFTQTATSTINAGTSETYTYTVSKYTPVVTWKQTTAAWNEIITNPYSIKVGDLSLDATSFTSQNTSLADVVAGNIQTYYTDGTARFVLVRDEDRKYSAVNATLDLVIASIGDACDLLNEPSERSLYTIAEGPALALSTGLADQLTFDAKRDAIASNYFFVQYSEDGGSSWNELANPDLGSSYTTYGPYNLPEETTHIRFLTKTGATLSKYYKNIRVTRKTYLAADRSAITLPTVVPFNSSKESFKITWSSCDLGDIHVASNNSKFQVSLDNTNFFDELDITGSSSSDGSRTIYIKYYTEALTGVTPDEATISVYNQGRSATVSLTGYSSIEADVHWPQVFYFESDAAGNFSENISMNAIVLDAGGNDITSYFDCYYSVPANDFASVSGNTLILNGTGVTQLTFHADPKFSYSTTYAPIVENRGLRVRIPGEACNSMLINTEGQDETKCSIYYIWSNDAGDIAGNLSFYGRKGTFLGMPGIGSIIVYQQLNGTWEKLDEISSSLGTTYGATPYSYSLNPAATGVKFVGSGTLDRYVKNVKVTQKAYLRADKASISRDIRVGESINEQIVVSYSDKTLLQPSVTGSVMSITSDKRLDNDCGEYGSYTLTLSGTFHQSGNYNETIHIINSTGDDLQIPVTINVAADEPYTITSGEWGTLTNWKKDGVQASVLPSSGNPVIVNGDVTVTADQLEVYSVQINPSATLTVAPTGGLTVGAGGIDNQGSIILLAASTGANLGQTGTLRISPDAVTPMPEATVQLYSKSFYSNHARWQYIGSPVTEASVENAQDIFYKCYLYAWDETNTSSVWANAGNYHHMVPFRGYATTQKVYGVDGRMATFSGQINPSAAVDCPLTYTSSQAAEDRGWNLLANSWTAPIDLTKFVEADFPAGADRTLYIYNTGSSLLAQYGASEFDATRASVTTLGSEAGQYTTVAPLSAAYTPGVQTVVPPMQGFFYVTNTAGSLHMDYRRLVWKGTQANKPLRAPQQGELTEREQELTGRIYVHLMAANDSTADHLYLLEKEDFTNGYDNGYDARKVLQSGLTSVFTNEPAGQMAVSATDSLVGTYVGIQTSADSIYTLRFAYLIGEPLYIRDMLTDSVFAITEETVYTFKAQPNTLSALRFRIEDTPANGEIGNTDVPTDLGSMEPNGQLWISGSMLCVSGNGMFRMYDAAGRLVMSQMISGAASFDTAVLPQGIYVAHIGNSICKIIR